MELPSLQQCINVTDVFTQQRFDEMTPEEQVNVYRVTSSIEGQYFCFDKTSFDEYEEYILSKGQEMINPYTNTKLSDEMFLNKRRKEDSDHENHSEEEPRNKSPPASKGSKSSLNIDQVVKNMGVMSCAEIKYELERSKMTTEEKIIFIKQNRSSSRHLISWLKSQHLSPEQLKYFQDAGGAIMRLLGQNAKEISTVLYCQEFDESDPDCVYLKELLQRLENEMNETPKSKATKKSNGYLKRIKEGVKTAAAFAWKGAKAVGSHVYNAGVFLAKLAVSKAFDLWKWMSSNPTTAFFSLMYLRSIRNKLCRLAGSNLKYFGPDTNKDLLLKSIRLHNPNYNPKPGSTVKDILDDVNSIGSKVATETLVSVGGTVVSQMWGKTGRAMTEVLAGAAGFLPGGPIISASIRVVMGAVIDSTEESLQFAHEQAIYTTRLNNAFGMLVDLINPMKCVDQLYGEFVNVLKIDTQTSYMYHRRKLSLLDAKKRFLLMYHRSTLLGIGVRRQVNMRRFNKAIQSANTINDIPRIIKKIRSY